MMNQLEIVSMFSELSLGTKTNKIVIALHICQEYNLTFNVCFFDKFLSFFIYDFDKILVEKLRILFISSKYVIDNFFSKIEKDLVKEYLDYYNQQLF